MPESLPPTTRLKRWHYNICHLSTCGPENRVAPMNTHTGLASSPTAPPSLCPVAPREQLTTQDHRLISLTATPSVARRKFWQLAKINSAGTCQQLKFSKCTRPASLFAFFLFFPEVFAYFTDVPSTCKLQTFRHLKPLATHCLNEEISDYKIV